jgi:hypothetical protein
MSQKKWGKQTGKPTDNRSSKHDNTLTEEITAPMPIFGETLTKTSGVSYLQKQNIIR